MSLLLFFEMSGSLIFNIFFILVGAFLGFLFAAWFFRREQPNENGQVANRTKNTVSPHNLLLETTAKMREGILVIGENQRILGANGAAKQIFSNVSGDFENKRLTDLTRNLEIHTAFSKAVAAGEQQEIRFESRDEKRVFDLHITPLALDADGAGSAVGVFYEISKLEKLETVRQEFLSNVSHELRTPLTSILAFVETLEDGALDDAENNRRFLGVIRKNAERMHRLINDILELSAIESGKIEIQRQKIRLNALVEEIKTNLAAKAAARRVTIENLVPPDTGVFADVVRLEQMLTNLMDNAVKFNLEGGKVTVSCERNGARDLIRVADTGEGLAPEQAERIFERFYRVDRARSRELGGTGLGLSIVKHLARLHGGEVSLTSSLGEGSTFTIELPPVNENRTH